MSPFVDARQRPLRAGAAPADARRRCSAARRYLEGERGQALVEHALILSLVAIVVTAALAFIGPAVASMVSGASSTATTAGRSVVRAGAEPPTQATAGPSDAPRVSERGETVPRGDTEGAANEGYSLPSRSSAALATVAVALMLALVVPRALRRASPWRMPGRGGTEPITADDLTRALANGEFAAHYQPVFNAATGRLAGMEALLRWESPRFGIVAARRFLARAEAGGVLDQLDGFVLTSACRFAKELQERGMPDLTVTVNASLSTVSAPDFRTALGNALEGPGLAPEHLQIALSEGAVATEAARAAEVIHRVRGLGVHVSVDGFWSAGLTAKQVGELGVDSVTVDLSLNSGNPATRRHITDAVAEARALGLIVTAKRVATDFELAFSRELGCEYVLGYALGEPMSGDAFLRRLPEFEIPAALAPVRAA